MGNLPPWTGNVAKVRVLEEVQRLAGQSPSPLRVLDVGVVGPNPLDLWWRFFEDGTINRLDLTGVDVAGIGRAEAFAKERGWKIKLAQASGYELAQRFAPGSFDVVVATQVLEHVRDRRQFMGQIAAVLRPGGFCVQSFDSGHFPPDSRGLALLKNTLSRLGMERFHEEGLTDEEAGRLFAGSGFAVLEMRFCNLHPLKWLYGRQVSAQSKDAVMAHWKALEEQLNRDEAFARANKHRFSDLYYKLQLQTR
jgi:SAM-dependent methyltransferase